VTKQLTEKSLALLLRFGRDAGNWGGTPLVGGNFEMTRAMKGNLTDLKKAGLVTTEPDGDRRDLSWLRFTAEGLAVLAEHGITPENW
jgi:hypothetical protein